MSRRCEKGYTTVMQHCMTRHYITSQDGAVTKLLPSVCLAAVVLSGTVESLNGDESGGRPPLGRDGSDRHRETRERPERQQRDHRDREGM